MTDVQPYDLLNRADELAPVPDGPSASSADWARHYAAQAMAAHAAFRVSEQTDLGYLVMLGVAATAAVIALKESPSDVPRLLWELSPEAGALNGEWIDYLADALEAHGINPADLYPWFDAKDFTAPARLPKLEVGQ